MVIMADRRRLIADQPHKATANGGQILIAEPKIERLAVMFAPVQTGSGTPSPSNVRPISGWSTIPVSIGSQTDSVSLGGTYYGGTVDLVSGTLAVTMVSDTITWGQYIWQRDNGSVYIRSFALSHESKSAPSMTQYNAICDRADWLASSLSDTVHWYIAVNGSGVQCAYISLPESTSAQTNVQIAYDLAEPIIYQLTPQSINALRGMQNVSSSAGSVEITYWTK